MARDDASVGHMIRMSLLLDAYGALLTQKQRQFMQLHYEQDLSFGELAREFGISRQAVHDSVKHAERTLENLESKLNLLDQSPRMEDRRDATEQILDLKQRVQQQGILYNTEWIVNELDRIVESLMNRGAFSQEGQEGSPDALELIGNDV